MPAGVADTKRGLPATSSPTLKGCRPSTSFSRVDGLDNRVLVNLGRQGKLDKDAVKSGITVQPFKQEVARLVWCLRKV